MGIEALRSHFGPVSTPQEAELPKSTYIVRRSGIYKSNTTSFVVDAERHCLQDSCGCLEVMMRSFNRKSRDTQRYFPEVFDYFTAVSIENLLVSFAPSASTFSGNEGERQMGMTFDCTLQLAALSL